jgi:large subunit ribosomal protein L30
MPPPSKGQLRIKQVRSGSGNPRRMKRTLAALGLKHHQDVVVHADHPALRGMLNQVRHLVEVTAATGSEGEAKKPRGKKADAKS